MLYLIVAYDKNHVIGFENKMPWHFKEDLAYFKQKTLGHTVLMGRKTYDSILAMIKKPLPDRKNIVISRSLLDDRVTVINDLESYLKTNQSSDEVIFVIGGETIYKAALPYAKRLYITHINHEYLGDTYFPKWDENLFKPIYEEEKSLLTFKIYERRSS